VNYLKTGLKPSPLGRGYSPIDIIAINKFLSSSRRLLDQNVSTKQVWTKKACMGMLETKLGVESSGVVATPQRIRLAQINKLLWNTPSI